MQCSSKAVRKGSKYELWKPSWGSHIKIANFESISWEHFMKYKPLISEEWIHHLEVKTFRKHKKDSTSFFLYSWDYTSDTSCKTSKFMVKIKNVFKCIQCNGKCIQYMHLLGDTSIGFLWKKYLKGLCSISDKNSKAIHSRLKKISPAFLFRI